MALCYIQNAPPINVFPACLRKSCGHQNICILHMSRHSAENALMRRPLYILRHYNIGTWDIGLNGSKAKNFYLGKAKKHFLPNWSQVVVYYYEQFNGGYKKSSNKQNNNADVWSARFCSHSCLDPCTNSTSCSKYIFSCYIHPTNTITILSIKILPGKE